MLMRLNPWRGDDPESVVDRRQVLDQIQQVLEALEPRHRVIIQRVCEGATLKSIGSEVGLSAERVRQIQARIQRRLRRYLSACGSFANEEKHITRLRVLMWANEEKRRAFTCAARKRRERKEAEAAEETAKLATRQLKTLRRTYRKRYPHTVFTPSEPSALYSLVVSAFPEDLLGALRAQCSLQSEKPYFVDFVPTYFSRYIHTMTWEERRRRYSHIFVHQGEVAGYAAVYRDAIKEGFNLR